MDHTSGPSRKAIVISHIYTIDCLHIVLPNEYEDPFEGSYPLLYSHLNHVCRAHEAAQTAVDDALEHIGIDIIPDLQMHNDDCPYKRESLMRQLSRVCIHKCYIYSFCLEGHFASKSRTRSNRCKTDDDEEE